MKKIMIFVMLLLSTSFAMAQFGDLEDIIRKAESGNSGNGSTENPGDSDKPAKKFNSAVMSLIDDAIKDGFYLVKQEYRLEDVNVPGSRYNREGSDCFGYTVSFMLQMKNGIVTSHDVIAPWEDDENFEEYKGGQYVPHISRTSYCHVGRKEWKVADKMFDPEGFKEGALKESQGLSFVANEEAGKGFATARGLGKKEVLVIWLDYSVDKDDVQVSYSVGSVEVEVQKNKSTCSVAMKARQSNANLAIVVEPTYEIGRIDLDVLGIIDLTKQNLSDGEGEANTCTMTLLRPLVGSTSTVKDAAEEEGDSGLSPSEGSNENTKKGKSNKNKK